MSFVLTGLGAASQLSMSAPLTPGQTYTLGFQPGGLGNPFDHAADWYGYAVGLPVTVTNVDLNGVLLSTGYDEIDVTFTYNGDGSDTGASIGASIARAANGPLGMWSYTPVAIGSGTDNPVKGGADPSLFDFANSSGGLPSVSTILWIAAATLGAVLLVEVLR